MKKTLFLLYAITFSPFSFSNDCHTNCCPPKTTATYEYRQELEQFKKNPDYAHIFNKEYHEGMRAVRLEIENSKKLTFVQYLARTIFLASGGVVVTQNTMPKLYKYVEDMCKKHTMDMPIIFVHCDEGLLNAFAQKLFTSSGGIFLGQQIITEMDDEALEAIIAHEIGHIKHNHVNKALALYLLCLPVASYCMQRYTNPTTNLTQQIARAYLTVILGETISSLLIGKQFEREADAFACKQMHKSNGLITFFKYLQEKEQKTEQEFADTYAYIEKQNELYPNGMGGAYYLYYLNKGFHALGKAYSWLYHNTRWGAHPSHEARIEYAQQVLAQTT